MRIMVLGSNGQLGKCLFDQFKFTDYELIFLKKSDIDITLFDIASEKIKSNKPDIIINAAAYTNVDLAEKDTDKASMINHQAVLNLTKICKEINCNLFHISTDYVFDGKSKKPYKEDDITNPKTIYGKTKLAGENVIINSGCNYIIIRTSWIFSEYGNNFFKTMIKIANQDEVNIVDDQFGCPSYAHDIASTIVELVNKIKISSFESGLYHYCGYPSCSWYQFACQIYHEASKVGIKTPLEIKPVKSSSFQTLAQRPIYSALNCEKIEEKYGVQTSDWKRGIRQTLNKITSKND